MAAEREVLEGVNEVASNEVVGKSGLDMSCYQDLAKSNGMMNHVNGDWIDNSYVFVSGADTRVDVVGAAVDLMDNDHLNSKESNNGENLEAVDGVVDGNQEAEAVIVAATDLEMHDDGGLGNAVVKSIGAVGRVSEAEVVSETSIEPPQIQESTLVLLEENTGVGGSLELKGVLSFDNCGDRIESSEETVEPPGVGLNMNPESSECKDDSERVQLSKESSMHISCDDSPDGNVEDLDGLMLGVNHSKDGTNLGTSDELYSEIVISKANAESQEMKGVESIAPDTNNTTSKDQETKDNIISKDIQETVVTVSETSHDLSLGHDSQDVQLEANGDVKDAGEGASKLVASKQPIQVEECPAMELRQDPELDISRESITMSLDDNENAQGAAKLEDCNQPIQVEEECEAMELKQDSEPDISRGESITLSVVDVNENQESQCQTSDDLTEVQGAANMLEGDQYRLEESETDQSNLKEQNDLESFNEEHQCKVVSLEAPACLSEDVKMVTHLELEAENAHQHPVRGVSEDQLDVCSTQETVKSNDSESFNDYSEEHECKIVPLETPACQSEDVKMVTQRDDLELEAENAHQHEEGGITPVLGVSEDLWACQLDVDIEDDLININRTAVPDQPSCENEFDSRAPQLKEIVPQHDEPCERADGSVKFSFGSLRTEAEVNSTPDKSNESLCVECEDDQVNNQASSLSEATKLIDDKPGQNDEGFPVHEIDLEAPMCSSTDARPSDETSSGNIEPGDTADDGVSYLANEGGLESETFEPIDSMSTQDDDDEHAEDVNVASKLNVHTSSDASSDKECVTDLFSGMAQVESAGSSISATAGQELEEIMKMPFNFLVKLPRFDDDKLREQIRHAQLQVDEKTQHRDAFRLQIQNKRPNLHAFDVAYNAAVSQEMDARRLLKATRSKIETLQSLIGRMKNAISVEDIDARIHNIQHRMQHETMPLKEEKQSIREIKQLKQHREYLSSTIGSQDEIQQALDQKDQNEDRLKALKKELIGLKAKALTAQTAAATVGKKYENEKKLIKELQNQYRVANDVRQEAYEKLLSLKKKLYEKNEHFRKYKNDVAVVSDYAFSNNRSALHHLCAGQMEMMMELWNNNDEFRKDYVRCNLRSSVRRLGTADGRSLGPDEEPPVLPSYAIVRFDRSTADKKTEANIAATVVADGKPVTVKILEPATSSLANGEDLQAKEEEHHLARKLEQDELDAIAKAKEEEEEERKKLHEMEKAKEAVERKKRMADKAQIRAELRARKEAEQREKEREKRLRKKERRAGEPPETANHAEILTSSDSGIDTVNQTSARPRRTQNPSHFAKQTKSKSIPPPLRNRNRRKLQHWLWVLATCLLIIVLFCFGNITFFVKISSRRSANII